MNLKQKYNREDFLEFLKRFLPNFEKEIRSVNSGSLQVIEKTSFLGQSTNSDLDLQVFEMTHSLASDARVSLAADGFRIMKDHGIYQALVIYKSEESEDWRLSLMTANPEVSEKGKIVKKLSNPRRYSFLLGPNAKTHTPESALKDQVKDFNDLKNRFSIEVVNKDFYAQVATLFTKLAGGKRGEGRTIFDAGKGCLDLVGVKDDEARKEFAVRLVGRLVFCWFLKKKSSKTGRQLLSDELLSLGAIKKHKNYYHKILEPLFFQVLNEPIGTRRKEYSAQPWSDTPFLNGGLFGPHENDYYDPGVRGISKHINTLKLPDLWFAELFEVFELYNFTIDENTSVDVELSVEPEMLGRIFENLLAEINPETGETARKSTGSYYTPRQIVEYMVDESLKQYLASKTGIHHPKLAALLAYDFESNETGLSKPEQEAVIKALDSVKIIDPACGSGAFPMGILQKMLLILQKVDPHSDRWLEKQLAKIENGFYKKEFEKKLRSENVSYVHKLGIIQNSIYGIDIQPIAVEISKLRFFLSLIVDENVDDSKPNRGVQPLPNLEFKFVCANSLIRLPNFNKDDQLFVVEDHESIEKLKNLRETYLNSSGKQKESIKLEFEKTQSAMMDFYFKSFKKQGDLFGNEKKLKKQQDALSTQLLGSWEPFSDKSCSWFDSEWMFGVKNGFDIVIANPPYNAELSDEEREYFKNNYNSVSAGRQDTAAIFVELANLISKRSGVVTYILPYRLFSRKRNHGQFQQWLLSTNFLSQIIYLGANIGFSANDEFMILQFLPVRNEGQQTFVSWKPVDFLKGSAFEFQTIYQREFIEYGEINLNLLKYDSCLLNKISANTEALENICKVRDGIVAHIREHLVSESKVDNRYVKFAGIAGRYELQKYYFKRDSLWLCYDINEARKFISDPVELRKVQLREKEIFLSRKIITSQNSAILKGTIDEEKIFVSNSIHSTYLRDEWCDRVELEFVLGLINSKLLNYFHNSLRVKATDLHPQILVGNLKKLPIKIPDKKTQKVIVDLVRKVIAEKENGSDALELERQIDYAVYGIYGLSNNEIDVIEKSQRE